MLYFIRYMYMMRSTHSAVSFTQQHIGLVSACHFPLCRHFQAHCMLPGSLHIITHPISHLLHAHMHALNHTMVFCS